MKSIMRNMAIVALGLAAMCLAVPALAALLTVASGTPVDNAAFTMTLPRPASNYLILNNRTNAAVYFRLNDSAASPTASATVYDVALDQNEILTIDNSLLAENPVQVIGCFSTTTPTLRIVGY